MDRGSARDGRNDRSLELEALGLRRELVDVIVEKLRHSVV
jgi:hypothetical protein